ncbi:MAG TPA: hypothetical protein VFS39_08555 [Nitrospira sp.]|nr:hypothetical protein [Nitrospira sp.]
MKIVCSWCRKEGKPELVGEKAPFEDMRETHGICVDHRVEVQARWRETYQAGGPEGQGKVSSVLFYWSSLLNVTRKRTHS